MKPAGVFLSALAIAAIIASGAYAYGGWRDAVSDAPALKAAADNRAARDLGADSLTSDRLAVLILVEDPDFYNHDGIDISTKGAGATTITQALAKRLAFDDFKPGYAKIRQTAYAISLENHLAKKEILALALDGAQMGLGPDGWVTGFHNASEIFFGAQPAAIDEDEFIALVAVLIAPGAFSLAAPDKKLATRIERIKRLREGGCKPKSHDDVWLEGCAKPPRRR